MKIIDEREMYKKNQTNKHKDRKEQRPTETTVKGWELNDFMVHLS